MSRLFDGILKTMTGGPITYLDANGQKQVAQPSRGSMSKAIVAAALTGLMTPDRYRQGAFGSTVRDNGAVMADSFNAGKQSIEAFRNKPQQMSDDQQARYLANLNNTANLAKNMAASALQQHEALGKMVDSSAPLMKSIRQQEPQALIEDNLSKEDAMEKLKGNHGNWTAVVSGAIPVLNEETGAMEEHPLYSIVDSRVKVPLSEEATKLYASVNPSFKGAWEKTNGKVTVSLQQAVAAQNLVDQAHVLQTFMNSAGLKQAFPGVKMGKISDIMAGPDGRRLAAALETTRDAISSGAPTYQKLNALQSAPGGQEVLEALGLDPDKVNQFVKAQSNAAIREQALAKEGGIGDKAPVSQAQTGTLKAAINRVEDPETRSALLSYLPPDRPLTMGEFDKVTSKLTDAVEKSHSERLRTGDPEVLQSEATSMLNGNLSSPKDLATIRSGGARMLIDSLLQKGAEARGLNPIDHTFATQEARAKMYADYSSSVGNKPGAQLGSFDTLMRHTGEALDANMHWARSGSPLINKSLSWLAENATNDQDYQRFKDTIIAPMKEYMNFLNQNRAEHESDIKAMANAIDGNATPATALTALRVITQTADARAAALGQRYLRVVNNNYEGLVSPTALQVMQRMGIKSQSGPLSVSIPKGWQGNAPSPMTPQAQKMLWEASGHDWEYATKLAKENGWQVTKQ
jgi:hypothetical protein